MLGFLKNLKPDPDGPEGDDQYYSGEAFYNSQDQHYYAPNQAGYNPYTQGQVVNQPHQQYSDQYHQPAGYGSQPQQPIQPSYYGYNPYPGQYYQFAQEPAMQQQQPGAGYYQDPQGQQSSGQQKTTITGGLGSHQGAVADLSNLDQTLASQSYPVKDQVDPKLLQKEEDSDLPQDELNSLDQEQKQPAAITTEPTTQTTAEPNAGLTETNTVPQDLAKSTTDTDEDLPKASEQQVDIAALRALNGPGGLEKAKEDTGSRTPTEDPLEKLMQLVKNKQGEVDVKKRDKLFVVLKHKVANEYLRLVVKHSRKQGISEQGIVEMLLKLDQLAEAGKVTDKFFRTVSNG